MKCGKGEAQLSRILKRPLMNETLFLLPIPNISTFISHFSGHVTNLVTFNSCQCQRYQVRSFYKLTQSKQSWDRNNHNRAWYYNNYTMYYYNTLYHTSCIITIHCKHVVWHHIFYNLFRITKASQILDAE